MDHANTQILIATFAVIAIILYKIFSARAGKNIYIRRIAGLNEIDEAVGRATEMGQPMLFHPGMLDFTQIGTLAALGVLGHVAKMGAKMGNRLIFVTQIPALVPVAEDIIRQAYVSEGRPELFNSEDVRFPAAASDQLALASIDIMHREKTASHFFFGGYDYTSLLLTEPGQHTGAIQIAGTDAYFQVPFFIASCDYTVICEELYAASAYLTREPTMLGSLIGQDYGKIVVLIIIILGTLAITIGPDTLSYFDLFIG
ncbi:MAG TPA: hypothetical protein PLP86_04595, partial [Armatimonadota bacterium]|nr:hypothetical protein [Armatimonadota bacterium]